MNNSISIGKGKGISGRSVEPPLSEQPVRILGIRRHNFYINLTVILILFFAFLGIGLDLGLNKNNDSSTSSSAMCPGLAVSSSNTTPANVQIFYQNSSTNSIHYRILSDATSNSSAKMLTLNKAPKTNLSMAATSFEAEGFNFHQLFYLMNGMIMLANITCPTAAPENCSTISDAAIGSGSSHPVAKDSTIATVHYGEAQNGAWMVFYHSKDYHLSQIGCTNGTWDKEGSIIGNKAVAGSGIAATSFGGSAVEVLYMDEAGNGIFTAEYLNGQWFIRMLFFSPLPSVTNQK